MKRILISFLSIMFILGIGLGLSHFGILKNEERVKAEESEFVMVEGASFRSYWSTPNCGITFGATISDTNPYVNNVRLFIAPYDFVETVIKTQVTITDYIQAFENHNSQYANNKVAYTIVEPAKIPYTGVVSFKAGIKNINVGNESRRFFGIYYYDTGSGREYATMPNGEVGQARSIAYLASSYYNDPSCVSDNDKYMTNFYMDRAIKTAVSKESGKNGNPVVDASTINYFDNAEQNTFIVGGKISGTFFDDFLNISGTLIKVGETTIDVGQRLNFKMDYTPFGEYLNQNDKKGNLVNITKIVNEVIKDNVKVGLEDNASYSLSIGKYDLSNKTLSTEDISFIDTIYTDTTEIYDTYNTKTKVPSNLSLLVPQGKQMVSDKVVDYNTLLTLGAFSHTLNGDGANGDIKDATQSIQVGVNSTFSGDEYFLNNAQVGYSAIKSKFTLTLENKYSDTYNKQNGSVALSGIEKDYYYRQSHNIQEITGYTSYLDEKRTEEVDSIEILGNTTKNVYYMPNTYNAILNYEIGDKIEQIITQIKYDYPFTLNAPNVEGYTPTQSIVGPYFMTDELMNIENGYSCTIEYNQTSLGAKSATYLDSTNSTVAKFYKVEDKKDGLSNPNLIPRIGDNAGTKGTFAGNGGYSHEDNSDNWDKYFVGVGSEIDYFSKADTFNFEFEFKYKQVGTYDGNPEKASRLIMSFAPASGNLVGNIFGVTINLGASSGNQDNITANAINFLSQDNNGSDVWPNTNEILVSNYIPNFNIKDEKWHKISVYKFDTYVNDVERGCVNLSIDDYRICEAHLVDNGALSNLLGEVYFGIQASCVSYDIRNANYSFGKGVTEGNIGLPINDSQIRWVNNDGEIVSNDTYWAGNGGVVHKDYGYTSYLFGEENDVVLQGKSVYYEFNLNLNEIDSSEPASKFLCIFGKEGGTTLFGAYLVLGGYSSDGYADRKIENVGFAKFPPDSNQHSYSDYISLGNNSVNYKDTIKIGCYKYVINNTAFINLYINDTLVAKSSEAKISKAESSDIYFNDLFTDDQLVGNVRFGFKGYKVNYSISNAKYICSNNDRLRIQETKMSNTVTQENFYFESKVHANAFMPGNYELDGDTSLGGIVVQSVKDTSKQWYFYMEINNGDSSDNYNRRVGLVPIVNGVPQWKSEYVNYYNGNILDQWKRAESIVYVSPLSKSFIDSDGNLKVDPDANTVGNVLSVYKNGKTLVFMLNSVPYLFVEDDDFAGKASVGFRSDGYSLGFKDSQFISEQSELIKIAKERSIITNEVVNGNETTYEINDGIICDGVFSDKEDKWKTIDITDVIKINAVRCSKTATNGERYEFRAFLGKNFLYVGIEAYSLSCYGYEGGVVLDETEYRILWHNFNMEISGIRNNQVSQTAFNVIGVNLGVANFGYTVVKEGDLYHIIAEVAIPYESFGLTTGASLVEDITFAVRPGLDGRETSASYESDTEQDGYYTDANHHFNGELAGVELEQNIIDKSGKGYWWNDGKLYYVTGAGVGILGSSDAVN